MEESQRLLIPCRLGLDRRQRIAERDAAISEIERGADKA
jgi:hypothetical protein